MRSKLLLTTLCGALAAVLLSANDAGAAGFFTNGVPPAGGTQYPNTLPLTGNETIPADTNLPAGLNPASEAITTGQLVGTSFSAAGNGWRNSLIGGDFGTNLFQRGTTTTGVANTLTYVADHWGAIGGASSSISASKQTGASDITATYGASLRFGRASSNTNTAAICVGQVVESSNSIRFQSQVAELVFHLLYGANYSGGAVTASILTGTGTDEGLASMLAGTWTGYAATAATAITGSTSWGRYSAVASAPAGVTEIGVSFCYTPSGTAGTNDWIELAGVQLDVNNAAQAVTAAGVPGVQASFERRPIEVERALQQRYAYSVGEQAAGVVQSPIGNTQGTTTTCTTFIPFPVTMRAAPTYTNALGAATFKLVSASQAATALSTPFSATLVANSPQGASINFTTTGMTAKDGCFLVGAGGTGVMLWSAEY